METKLYELRGRELWGDYGAVLISGFARRKSPEGPLLLQRTGPFQPPISFPSMVNSCIVVTSAMKNEFEKTSFGSRLEFREALLDRIIQINWHEWDFNATEPEQHPDNGEPEDYIWNGKHSPETADKIGKVWEVVCPVIACVNAFSLLTEKEQVAYDGDYSTFVLGEADYNGLFCSSLGGNLILDEPTKRWFESIVSEWVSFVPLKLEYDPKVLKTLEEKREHHERTRSHLRSDEYKELIRQLSKRHGFVMSPAFARKGLSFYRYCVVQLDSIPPKLSVSTFSGYESLANYLELKLDDSTREVNPLNRFLVLDLETNRQLHYEGNNQFTASEFGGI